MFVTVPPQTRPWLFAFPKVGMQRGATLSDECNLGDGVEMRVMDTCAGVAGAGVATSDL